MNSYSASKYADYFAAPCLIGSLYLSGQRLQWQALQVRCEVDGVALTPPSGTNARHWALRGQAQLAPVLGPEGKICVREVEGLGEVADLCVRN